MRRTRGRSRGTYKREHDARGSTPAQSRDLLIHVATKPAAQERGIGEAGKMGDAHIDVLRRGAPVLAVEQKPRNPTCERIGLMRCADRRIEPVHDGANASCNARRSQPLFRLPHVEGVMARFVADDAVEKLIEDWVIVLLREAAVRLNSRALVHGTPRHVQSEEILPRGRHHLRDRTVDAIPPRGASADTRWHGMPRAIEEL